MGNEGRQNTRVVIWKTAGVPDGDEVLSGYHTLYLTAFKTEGGISSLASHGCSCYCGVDQSDHATPNPKNKRYLNLVFGASENNKAFRSLKITLARKAASTSGS